VGLGGEGWNPSISFKLQMSYLNFANFTHVQLFIKSRLLYYVIKVIFKSTLAKFMSLTQALATLSLIDAQNIK
jgi:hypothetical protein